MRSRAVAFTVGAFAWSPDGKSIAFDHRVNGSPASSGSADISIVTVADGAVRKLVTQDGPDTHPVWSPDGSRIAFESSMANPAYFYANGLIAVVPAAGGAPVALSSSFDEDPSLVAWKQSGLFFSASARTYSYLYRLDPTTKTVTKISPADQTVNSGFSLSQRRRGDRVPSCRREVDGGGVRREQEADRHERQTTNWTTSTLEVVSWKSQDGAAIEGVLHKPLDFDPARKYPLLVVIHGGPTGVSRAVPFTSATYPIDVWMRAGVLVLEPNYRGSAGYGEKFRSLNVRNLGVGDAWDVLSGVDALIAKGMVDPARVGTMGWSQGGYISAFLATHDAARFKAISVGAGISDWMTYYVNTDIHPFTRQYLKAHAVGRPGDLRQDVADHLHQAGEDADADSARRDGSARAAAQRLRAVSRSARQPRADEADRLPGLWRHRPRAVEAQEPSRDDGAQPRVVRSVSVPGQRCADVGKQAAGNADRPNHALRPRH